MSAISLPCMGNAELFSPPDGEREPSRALREADAVHLCKTGNNGHACPILAQCAVTDLFTDRTTVRGGLTTPERDQLRKEREAEADMVLPEWDDCGTQAAYSRHLRDKAPVCVDCRSWSRHRAELMRAKKLEAAA